jgi:hypothetical protein
MTASVCGAARGLRVRRCGSDGDADDACAANRES